ncbi:MAG TPA: response regulator [Geobacteraceae bacterium]|nr:response regulator [Geobacteraceae bacterium]
MNLVGNLEDLGLAEILQIVSLSRKSGILTLRGRRGEGEIVFRNGEVVRASSPDCQESLTELLVRRGDIDSATMELVLAERERIGFTESMGTILSRRFKVPAETVNGVIREQIENIVISFFEWRTGTFDFELQEHAEMVDTVETEQMQFILEQGINSQYLAFEGARRLDEKRHQYTETGTIQTLTHETTAEKERGSLSVFHGEEESLPADFILEPEKRHAIVLVEDYASTRETLASSLEECGYEVYPFGGGADSPLMRLASLQRDGLSPTLLIDLFIPKMDGTGNIGGIELLELIKANFSDIPVLAMADRHNEEAERQLRGLGFPLIIKPGDEEIGDQGVLNDFMASLLPGLNQVRAGGGPCTGRDNVNFGEELLQEMGEEPSPNHSPVVQSTGIALLRGMLEELKDPTLEGGIILLVLRFAAEFMNRAVILMVKREKIEGLGQFGITPTSGSADSILRNMKIPRGEDSIFSRVMETGISVKVTPDEGVWTRYLLERLGGGVPAEIFVGPIVSEGKVVALLYGDNIPENKQIGDTDSLEIFLSQAGMAMEKAFLQRKLKGKAPEVM